MTGCHACKFASELASGEHRDMAYEDTPCAGCRAADRAAYVLEYDEGRGDLEQAVEETETGEDLMPVEVLSQVLKGLLLLPAAERDTVALRYGGMKYRDIAEIHGVTMACVEKRHRTAIKRFPELKNLFPSKSSKTKRRRRKTHTKQAA